MIELDFWQTKLSVLDKRINAFTQGYRQNIAILGDDEKEISFLLENYFKTNKLKELIYIHTTSSYADRRSIFKSVAFAIFSEYLNRNECLDDLINCASLTLSDTANYIKDTLKKNNPPTFLDTLEIINKFVNESGKKTVLVIEGLLGLKSIFTNFHNDFSKFIVLQRNCMVILTGLDIRESEKTLYSDLNFLFGNFEKILLSEANCFESYRHLKAALMPLKCSPFFISFFVNILGSNSIYYSLIKDVITQEYKESDEEASIISVIRRAFYEPETYLFQRFIRQIDIVQNNFKNPISIIKLLLALSDGYLRKKELASLHIVDPKELTLKLQKLSDLNYIENLGAIYRIKDPFFYFWLSHIFKPSFFPPLMGWQKKNILFENKMRQTIAVFKEEFFKDKVKKVLELIAAFKNDTLKIGKDRYRLPSVVSYRVMFYPEKSLHVVVAEGDEIIFAAIKESLAEDSDIFDFMEKGKTIRGKAVKKIFISLDTFSISARLAAKNNKLIVWDINDLNHLMQAYQRPVISLNRQCTNGVASENFSNF